MREWGTGRVARGVNTESYSIENLKYEATLEVDRDEIADDKTGQIRVRVAELAERAATHKDYLIAQLLITGHVSGASGSQSNKMEADAADPNDPTTDEFGAGLRATIGTMMGFKDDQGDPMAMSATGLVCVVPTTMYLAALEAVSATVVSSTTNVLSGAARVITC